MWRGLAVGILFVALLIEAIGEPFYVVGDVLLVLLTTAALAVFLYALDVPRMRRALQRHFATTAFRKALFPDNRDNDNDAANLRSHLRAAVEAVPESISKAAVVRRGLSYVQAYKLVQACGDGVGELHDLVVVHGLLRKVDPLLSLAGAELGGRVPRCMGAFFNVMRLSLADMKLEDDCDMHHLKAMPKLRDLILDGNLFGAAPKGLGELKQVTRLSLARIRTWESGGIAASETLREELQGLVGAPLDELNLEGSPMAAVSSAFADVLWQFGSFISPVDGKRVASTGARDGEGGRRTPPEGGKLRGTHFTCAQFKKGGCSLVELSEGGFLSGDIVRAFGLSVVGGGRMIRRGVSVPKCCVKGSSGRSHCFTLSIWTGIVSR